MIAFFLAAVAALQPAPAAATQALEARACTAEPNFVTRERVPFLGSSFRFSGTVTAEAFDADDFTPFASLALLDENRPEELSAVLSVQPATRRRFDVTLRRLINNELRERSIVGRVRTGQAVPFALEVGDGFARFRMGGVNVRVPLNELRPNAIVLGCSSGSFRFDNLVFDGSSG